MTTFFCDYFVFFYIVSATTSAKSFTIIVLVFAKVFLHSGHNILFDFIVFNSQILAKHYFSTSTISHVCFFFSS